MTYSKFGLEIPFLLRIFILKMIVIIYYFTT